MRLEVKGIDETIKKLEKTGKDVIPVLKEAVFQGTRPVADQLKKNLQNLPTEKSVHGGLPRIAREGAKLKGLTIEQKADVIEAMGIAPIRNDSGNINSKVGFDGYGSVPTSRYPQGIPNQLLVRSLESGTYFRAKTPVIRPAVTMMRRTASAAMEKVIKSKIGKEFK